MAPFATPLAVTGENFGRVPRVYTEILQDRAVFCAGIELCVVVLHKNPARHRTRAMRTSENPLKANFREFLLLAVRRRTVGSMARALKVKPENLA